MRWMRTNLDVDDPVLPVLHGMKTKIQNMRANLDLTESEVSTLDSMELAIQSMMNYRMTRLQYEE